MKRTEADICQVQDQPPPHYGRIKSSNPNLTADSSSNLPGDKIVPGTRQERHFDLRRRRQQIRTGEQEKVAERR